MSSSQSPVTFEEISITVTIEMHTPEEPPIDGITSPSSNADKNIGPSLRNRSAIKAPPAFPVAFSPLRERSTKRGNKGWKTTSTVTMPARVQDGRVSKTESSSNKVTDEQKAAIRAIRLEARNFAKVDGEKEKMFEDDKVIDEMDVTI